MSTLSSHSTDLPPEQQAIRAKCFHPTGSFIDFRKEEVEQSIPQRFEQQVRMFPDRMAVKTSNQQFTYDELNQAANQVAWAIMAQCGEAQEPVALLFEQGAQMVAAILGVLKSGKIYVPLEPSFPEARTTYMLHDVRAGLLLTNDQNLTLAKKLAHNSCQILNIDHLDTSVSTENPGLCVSPESLAWILYTSGSTGQPKGIFQSHRNLLHTMRVYVNNFHICPDDRHTLLYSYSAVASVRGIFGALLSGAAFYPFDLKERGVNELANWLNREEITIYHSFPTVFRHLVGTLKGEEQFPQLRLIYLSGEASYKKDLELYRKYFAQDCICLNGIGPTETGSFRWYLTDKDTKATGNLVPLGYAIEGMETLLLGEDGQEVAGNGIGEIAVKSRYLSLGYWRNSDLTSAKFLSCPDGERLYLTGDLGRMRPDGCLEYAGRRDFQFKVRGYRIEATEVEAALLDLDTVKEAAVLAREDLSGEVRLVAYVVANPQLQPRISDVRRSLLNKLPDYMVPSALVLLDALPALPNGKIDRRALPALSGARPDLEHPFVPPRTSLEEKLAGIWSQALGLNIVGIHDNFLELGGDSLLAGQVVSGVISTFQLEVPPRLLFEAPTVADMAVVLVQKKAEKAAPGDIDRMLAELEALSEEHAE